MAASQQQEKKIRITFDEFQKLSMLIVGVIKELEREG